MKKTIYKYFFYEFARFFIVTLLALAAIVWVIQAVNFLDLVTEDGHAFKIYFYYSILTLSKVFTKLIPFCFLIAIVLTILKFENDNELIVLWTSGLNKIHFVNLIFRISLLVMLLQLVLTTIINPTLLNLSRSIIKNSELQFVPSLLKAKQFNDTVESLTIFVDKKNENGIYENIFILDEGKILSKIATKSSTITAKSGYVSSDEKNLVLLNGNIQKLNEDFGIDVIKFDRTVLNLSGISTKSISDPKIQETSTLQIIRCIQYQYLPTYDYNFGFKIEKNYKYYDSVKEGVFLTRDLVSEPPNVLSPKTYVQEIKKLSKLGLKIKAYDEKELKKLGLNALLGVGQGSANETYLVAIEWDGKKQSKQKPLAFVGKGVCFDTGGISLKPAKFMEEMKYDMAGSAVVVGLLKSLALRKAKVNAVGVVGLVENMPGGNAQRPGDIVKSYSGKTIEVLNTDAEGRLVLADALSFAEKKYKPKFIIDLATLTGAIIISLGEEYAGLFSNNDELSKNIFKASENVNEKVWRLPLHKNYDKLMNSSIADMQNINYTGGAGSITAAQFLQRFILNKTPWAHLDIAGMAFSKKAANLNPGGATGFGVRLLNNLINEYYE